jgi:hypothetical protein
MERDDLIELRKFAQLHDAELAISVLEAAKIGAILRDSAYGGLRPETSIAGGGATVLVRRDQWEAARQLLDTPVEHQEVVEAGEASCASCGRRLESARTVCPDCNAEDHQTVLDPGRTRSAIGNLKVAVVLGTLALMILPVIVRRLSEIRTDVWVTVAYVLGGLAAAIFLLKILTSGSDQRL